MLMQEKQYDTPQRLFCCTETFVMGKLVFKVFGFKTRVYIDTFYSKPNNTAIL